MVGHEYPGGMAQYNNMVPISASGSVSQNEEKPKQRRSENFSNAEKLLLLKILENAISVTENKATDSNSCKQKELAWQKITSSFNNSTNGLPRGLVHLQSLWKNMKQKFKNRPEIQQFKGKHGLIPPPSEMLEMMKKLYDHHSNVAVAQLEIRPASDVPSQMSTHVQPRLNTYNGDAEDPEPVNVAEMPNGLSSPTMIATEDDAAEVITLTEVSEDSTNQLFKMAQEEHNMKMKLLRVKLDNAKRRMEMEEELHRIKKKKLSESWVLT